MTEFYKHSLDHIIIGSKMMLTADDKILDSLRQGKHYEVNSC